MAKRKKAAPRKARKQLFEYNSLTFLLLLAFVLLTSVFFVSSMLGYK